MKKVLFVMAAVVIFASAFMVGQSDALTKSRPKCPKACQKLNDVYFENKEFTDYFVNDSDGKKDSVFTIYHGVPFPTAGEGVKCDVLKSYENNGISTNIICPNGTFSGTGSRAPKDDQ